LETDDPFLAETYANIFMVSFVRAQRPDMLVFLQGPPAKLPPERYTSMEDVQYLADDVGMTNYGWFQFQIHRLADLLLTDKPLPKLLAELKAAFDDSTRRRSATLPPSWRPYSLELIRKWVLSGSRRRSRTRRRNLVDRLPAPARIRTLSC
jgi:hypothetical protein